MRASLSEMPIEVARLITSRLPFKETLRLSESCSRLASLFDFNHDPRMDYQFAIRHACKKCCREAINKLLTVNHVDRAITVQWACENGEVAIVIKILQEGMNLFNDMIHFDNVTIAAKNGHNSVLELRWRDFSEMPKVYWEHAFILAAKDGHVSACKFLLDILNVNASNTVLYYAALNDQMAIVDLLVMHYIVDLSSNSYVVFRCAARNGHAPIVKLLLKDSTFYPGDALLDACQHGHLSVLKAFYKDRRIQEDSRFWYSNYATRSSFLQAVENGHSNIVSWLMKKTNLNPAANENEAIRSASSYGQLKVVQLLLKDHRVDPASVDSEAIRLAARNGHLSVVKQLLKSKKIDPMAKGNEAFREAAANGHSSVLDLLLRDNSRGSTGRN
jgi:ankyrin repeat protein